MSLQRLIKLICIVILAIRGAFLSRICAQTLDLSVPVSFHYDGVTLARALDDLSGKYNIGFSYSRQIIPIHQRIYCNVNKMPFGQAMETLFEQTQVVFGVIEIKSCSVLIRINCRYLRIWDSAQDATDEAVAVTKC